jgi:hypothetical protein
VNSVGLTEIAGLTPTIPFAQLHDDDPSPPGSRPLSMVGKCSRQTTEGRAGCRDPAREPVEVEMGGGMGDLAVLLRTIDFAAQVGCLPTLAPARGVHLSAFGWNVSIVSLRSSRANLSSPPLSRTTVQCL